MVDGNRPLGMGQAAGSRLRRTVVAHKVLRPLRGVGEELDKRRLGRAVRKVRAVRRWKDDVRRDVVPASN